MKKRGKASFEFDSTYILSSAVVTGPTEKEGPLGKYFDYSFDDIYCNSENWEKAEMNLVKKALEIALVKACLKIEDLDLIIGGDLNNQIAISSYALRNSFIPYLGTYAACSTLTENMLLASIFIDSKMFKKVLCLTSSHNATSERQFRYPTEYGGQKPDSFTFTTTAAGVCLLSNKESYVKVTKATIGKIIDVGLSDAQDMGRTMAPAAAFTLVDHLNDFLASVDDYDLIVTGDLSTYGSEIFIKCLLEKGIDVKRKHIDCGTTLYNVSTQEVFAGGSGCGCVSAVVLGYLVKLLEKGIYQKILILATGALLNPIMVAQKETIPCISHAICLERSKK